MIQKESLVRLKIRIPLHQFRPRTLPSTHSTKIDTSYRSAFPIKISRFHFFSVILSKGRTNKSSLLSLLELSKPSTLILLSRPKEAGRKRMPRSGDVSPMKRFKKTRHCYIVPLTPCLLQRRSKQRHSNSILRGPVQFFGFLYFFLYSTLVVRQKKKLRGENINKIVEVTYQTPKEKFSDSTINHIVPLWAGESRWKKRK